MIPLVTRASNSSLVSPSTPRNTGGTEHEMENDGRDNDSVSPDHDTNVMWEVCNPSIHTRQLKRDQKLQIPKRAGDKKERQKRCHFSSATNRDRRVTIDYKEVNYN